MLVWLVLVVIYTNLFFEGIFLLLQLCSKFPYFVDLLTDHGQNFERHGHLDLVIGYGPISLGILSLL